MTPLRDHNAGSKTQQRWSVEIESGQADPGTVRCQAANNKKMRRLQNEHSVHSHIVVHGKCAKEFNCHSCLLGIAVYNPCYIRYNIDIIY